jgi:hypothetical protein
METQNKANVATLFRIISYEKFIGREDNRQTGLCVSHPLQSLHALEYVNNVPLFSTLKHWTWRYCLLSKRRVHLPRLHGPKTHNKGREKLSKVGFRSACPLSLWGLLSSPIIGSSHLLTPVTLFLNPAPKKSHGRQRKKIAHIAYFARTLSSLPRALQH